MTTNTDTGPAIRVIMMPKDTNALGTIFGGIILSYIDQAGAVEARRRFDRRFVTVALREVVFVEPVYVGDLVSFYTEMSAVGKTSVTVRVTVEANRSSHPDRLVRVTEAEVIYVAVDQSGSPVLVQEVVSK